MSENIRDKNFLLIKLTLLIVFSVYGIMNAVNETGVSVKILLLVSLYIGCLTAKEFLKGILEEYGREEDAVPES